MNNFKPTTPVAASPSYVVMPSNVQMREIATERIRLTRALCDAAFEYLSFSDQLTLNTQTPEFEPPPYYTIEMLMKAQREREQLQSRIDQMETAIAETPRTNKSDIFLTMMEAGMVGPLKAQLERCDGYITEIQQALEQEVLKEKKE